MSIQAVSNTLKNIEKATFWTFFISGMIFGPYLLAVDPTVPSWHKPNSGPLSLDYVDCSENGCENGSLSFGF